MIFEMNQSCFGFRVLSVRHSEELKADAYILVHERTGCRLIWIDNGAENKVFSIAFRTLPDDDTGVFHILEHSVLCGSERYPVREPFVELLKGSMNTFLNAMTFPDMTMYPVGSRNNQDLLNLTGVYLDAVFCPRSILDERIFRQEGWHIEPDENGKYIYKGVVYNEMKGSMSNVDNLGERRVLRQLFPDNGYGWNSGGEPESIPELTYEKYLEQYRLHYHPTNACIYLDGAVPMEQMLPLIASYLDSYEALENIPDNPLQTPVSSRDEIYYELGQDESEENRSQLYLTRIVGSWRDRVRNMAISLIGDVLTDHNDSPLKRLVLEKNLAQDISMGLDDDCEQSFLYIHAENVTDGREDELLREIHRFGERLAREGLNRDEVESSLNHMIFHIKEEEEPQGIGRAMRASSAWLYGGDPLEALENDQCIAALREMVAGNALNQLAAELFSEQNGTCLLRLLPSKSLGEEKRRAEEKRLAKITGAWTEKERTANEMLLSSLREWQQTPDTPEALSTLPMLRKEDADLPPVWTETEEVRNQNVLILRHLLPCSGIVYLRSVFSISDLSAEEIVRVNMICSLLGKLPTTHHDAKSLQTEVKRWLGRLSFSVFCRNHPEDCTLCAPALVAHASVLQEHVPRAEALLSEILLTTDFSSDEKIMETVMQIEIAIRQRAVSAGHYVGIRNVLSHFSAEYALKNRLEGDEAIRYVHAFVKNPKKYLAELRETAEKLRSATFCRKRLLLSETTDAPADWTPFLNDLPEGTAIPQYAPYSRETAMRQGYRIPAQIGFAVRGYRLSECGIPFRGAMWLTTNILSLSYLWNRVRVQGGAYGAGIQIDRQGNVFSYSYRDPTPDLTLQADQDMSAFLRDFVQGHEKLDKYIISSLNDLNPLLSAREKGTLADARYLSGYTREKAEAIRQDILHATGKDLLDCAEWLDAFARDGAVCVIAHQDALERCENLVAEDL